MNTQRPEWNDGNNALVGNGLSMVTLYYLRRFLHFFIGILEDGQKSLDVLSDLVNKPYLKLPHINKTQRSTDHMQLTNDEIDEFVKKNELDYLIYNYCKQKLDTKYIGN